MSQAYHFKKRVELYHVDGAGVMFYGEIFYFVHSAFAQFLRDQGHSIKDTIEKRDYVFPVVDAQASYTGLIFLDNEVDIELEVGKVGKSSFNVLYRLTVSGKEVASSKIIHAVVDRETLEKKEIPQLLKQALTRFK